MNDYTVKPAKKLFVIANSIFIFVIILILLLFLTAPCACAAQKWETPRGAARLSHALPFIDASAIGYKISSATSSEVDSAKGHTVPPQKCAGRAALAAFPAAGAKLLPAAPAEALKLETKTELFSLGRASRRNLRACVQVANTGETTAADIQLEIPLLGNLDSPYQTLVEESFSLEPQEIKEHSYGNRTATFQIASLAPAETATIVLDYIVDVVPLQVDLSADQPVYNPATELAPLSCNEGFFIDPAALPCGEGSSDAALPACNETPVVSPQADPAFYEPAACEPALLLCNEGCSVEPVLSPCNKAPADPGSLPHNEAPVFSCLMLNALARSLPHNGDGAPVDCVSLLHNGGPADPVYLLPADKIESDHPAIISMAAAVAGWIADNWDKAEAIFKHVIASMQYDLHSPCRNCGALAALRSGAGVCEDYAALFVALCRAEGIPARQVYGYTAPECRKGNRDVAPEGRAGIRGPAPGDASSLAGCRHCWAEFYLEGLGWLPADPTLNMYESDCIYFAALPQADHLAKNYCDRPLQLCFQGGQLDVTWEEGLVGL